ncbi:MAG: hypothetical protein ABSA63_05165 [Thermoplasmata archaeon]|jgi:hypothetical protein
MTDLSAFVGVGVLVVSLGTGGLALVFLRGNARLDAILRAFAQITLIPSRRRRFLLLIWVEVFCFLVTGVLLGLYRLGFQFGGDPDHWFTLFFLAGMATLGALVWVGLRTTRLTELERATAEKDAPTILESVWMVAYRRLVEEPPERPRP